MTAILLSVMPSDIAAPMWVATLTWAAMTLAGAIWFGVRIRSEIRQPTNGHGSTMITAREDARWQERLFGMNERQLKLMETMSDQLVEATHVDQELIKLIRHHDDRSAEVIRIIEETRENVSYIKNYIGSRDP